MFGHLKAVEFINLIEGAPLPSTRRAHLDECSRCHATWKSMAAAHKDFARIETEVVEPDWSEFRSSVRDALLSRSAQRASIVRRWTGWPVRPVMAWALSVIMVVGGTAGALLWHQKANHSEVPVEMVQQPGAQPTVDTVIDAEMTVWSQTSIFEELSQLRTTEEESLRTMLMEAELGSSER
jgi:hypothetical protein